MDRVQQIDPQRKVLSGKDRCKVRDVLLKKKESASRIQAYFSTPLLCLSSCASSFISTSIFINLLLASQGDRIQALTRISPQIDWYCSAQGMLGKKALAFPPHSPFPSLPFSFSYASNFVLFFPGGSLSVTCLCHVTFSFRADRQLPLGSDGVICSEFTKRSASKMAAGLCGNDCIKSGVERSISTHQQSWQTYYRYFSNNFWDSSLGDT